MKSVRDEQLFFSSTTIYNEEIKQRVYDTFFYDWKTGEITRNDLTEFLNQNNSYVFDNCIHLDRRYLFVMVKESDNDILPNKLLKIDWDEDYSNIQVTDMSYLFREIYEIHKKKYAINDLDIIISLDGSWVTTTITDFSEYNPDDFNNRFITTRVFFHMDNKYPNGISIPIFSDGNEHNNDDGAFVKHPEYGMCYAQEWHNEGMNYLRLYKMEDVLTAINSGSRSLPFNYDDSKNYLFTRVYTYDKQFIKGWIFDEDDTDIETNQAIDSIIKYCEAEIYKTPISDNQLSRVELYKDDMFINVFPDKKTMVDLYINKANEDDTIYYIEIDFYILGQGFYNPNSNSFERHKIIICNQYFNFSESGHDVQKHMFWRFYKLLVEGESAYKFFLNEMQKHRR
jgi:hypothetical protein